MSGETYREMCERHAREIAALEREERAEALATHNRRRLEALDEEHRKNLAIFEMRVSETAANPTALITTLASRGVALALEGDDKILATGGSVDELSRRALEQARGAVIEILKARNASEVI